MIFAMRSLLAFSFCVLSANASFARDDTFCSRNGDFAMEPSFALAKVQGTKRAYFHSNTNGCPWTGEECSSASYVIPGNTVIVSRIREGYACAFYPSDDGGTEGWVPASQLDETQFNSNPPLSAWLGKWSSGDDPVLTLSAHKGELIVKGRAVWPDPEGSEAAEFPVPKDGELEGQVSRTSNIGKYADTFGCKVTFTLLESFLIAKDNKQCGGYNVSFTNIYLRAAD